MQNTAHPPGSPISDLSRIAQDLQIRKIQVENVVQLLDEGNTVPFITRYRKERTGGLNEELIRRIQERVHHSRQLAERKQTILKSIEAQGKLTDPLRDAIMAADTPKRLEDLYVQFKPKKKSLASDAKERGLEPLATAVWSRDEAVANLPEVVNGLINPEKQLNSAEDVLTGAQHILAEQIAESAEVRGPVRHVIWETGELVSTKADNVSDEQGKDFRDYFAFRESVRFIPPHRILAVNRGEKENVLKVKVEWNSERLRAAAVSNLPLADHPHREFLEKVVDDALNRLLLPSLEREVRRELTEHAQDSAVHIFARNLRSLLLQPPLRGKRVLAVDPGLRTGCKLAALDEQGTLLEDTVIYPHAPANKAAEAKSKLETLIRRHQLSIIAIGNGTACRETEQLVSELISDLESGKTCILPDPPPRPPAPPKAAAAPPLPAPAAAAPSEPITPAATDPPSPSTAEAPSQAPATPSVSLESPAAESSIPPVAREAAASAPQDAAPHDAAVATATPPAVPVGEPQQHPAAPAAEPSTATDAASTPSASSSTAAGNEPAAAVADSAAAAPAPATEAAPAPEPPAKPPEPLPELPKDIAYVIVNEAGASDYSASPIAREEFPNHDATTRGTISIGRRLQDPLAELVKIDPQHVGVGLYQHDVRPKHLKESLEAVVESSVNEVGVDLNTASVPLLRHVSGLNQMVARDLVEFRVKNGAFRSRDQLKGVPGIGEARFTQAAGFLKITDGDEPLDSTWIHPESYGIARQLLTEIGFSAADLRDKGKQEQLREKLKTVNPTDVAARMNAGEPTVRDILEVLARPGRDPRDDRPPPIFKKGILKLEDLQPGMELKGTVLNVVPFGAFVDIGLKDTGLVHISQMANRYIKNPYEVVAVGDVVTVWVIKVEGDRRRASLTMIAPGSERKPPERRPTEARAPQGPRPPRSAGEQGDRGPRPQRQGGPPQGQPQHASGPPQQRGGPSPHRGGPRPPRPAQAPQSQGQAPPPPPPPPPPPRKPAKPKPLPKLSQEALKGKSPLHSFGELEAFFKAKDAPPPTPPAPPAEAAAPPSESRSSDAPAAPEPGPEKANTQQREPAPEADQVTNEPIDAASSVHAAPATSSSLPPLPSDSAIMKPPPEHSPTPVDDGKAATEAAAAATTETRADG